MEDILNFTIKTIKTCFFYTQYGMSQVHSLYIPALYQRNNIVANSSVQSKVQIPDCVSVLNNNDLIMRGERKL